MSQSNPFDEKFWDQKYDDRQTGWDIGHVSTPLKVYIDQLEDKDLMILIPGAGNAYEAEYLWQSGFQNTYTVDISKKAIHGFHKRFPDFPKGQAIHSDFFELDGSYDLIFEQTFFCALPKNLRIAYVNKMHKLLSPGGSLTGVLFNVPLNEEHPPFGGSMNEYQQLFETHFQIEIMEECYNSIEPRMGNEVFIKLRARD